MEEAYRRKCIELRRKTIEVEESNNALRLRKVRLARGVRKLRLERAFLLEALGKRMNKNGGMMDALEGFNDFESDDSDEAPPSPEERSNRPKRSYQRQNLASPVPSTIAEDPVMHQQVKSVQGGARSGNERVSGQGRSPSTMTAGSNNASGNGKVSRSSLGHDHGKKPKPSQNRNRQPSQSQPQDTQQTTDDAEDAGDSASQELSNRAYTLFLEKEYYAQAEKHPAARTKEDLDILAERDFDSPAFTSLRKTYEDQARQELMAENADHRPGGDVLQKTSEQANDHDQTPRSNEDVEMQNSEMIRQ